MVHYIYERDNIEAGIVERHMQSIKCLDLAVYHLTDQHVYSLKVKVWTILDNKLVYKSITAADIQGSRVFRHDSRQRAAQRTGTPFPNVAPMELLQQIFAFIGVGEHAF